MEGICHHCGKKTIVQPVDPVTRLIDPNRPDFICNDCKNQADNYLQSVDNYFNNLFGIKHLTDDEIKIELVKLNEMKKERLSRSDNLSFFQYIKTPEFKKWSSLHPVIKSDNYKEWCEYQKYKNDPIINSDEYIKLCRRATWKKDKSETIKKGLLDYF